MATVMILGATSAIAQDVARNFAKEGAAFYLVGRGEGRLRAVAGDLEVRGAKRVQFRSADLDEFDRHKDIVEQAWSAAGAPDVVLLAYGVLGDPAAAQKNPQEARKVLITNLLSPVSLITDIANRLEAEGRGTLAVISSVAGDMGRRSNYVYGAGKGGLSVFLEGLTDRLQRAGVKVVTLKPGLVDTPMTAHMPKNRLFASSQRAGKLIYKAIRRGKETAYIPRFWKWVVTILKLAPKRVVRKLDL